MFFWPTTFVCRSDVLHTTNINFLSHINYIFPYTTINQFERHVIGRFRVGNIRRLLYASWSSEIDGNNSKLTSVLLKRFFRRSRLMTGGPPSTRYFTRAINIGTIIITSNRTNARLPTTVRFFSRGGRVFVNEYKNTYIYSVKRNSRRERKEYRKIRKTTLTDVSIIEFRSCLFFRNAEHETRFYLPHFYVLQTAFYIPIRTDMPVGSTKINRLAFRIEFFKTTGGGGQKIVFFFWFWFL